MPVYQEAICFDEEFARLSIEPIIVNDYVNNNDRGSQDIRHFLINRLNSDSISMLPSCYCGDLVDSFNIDNSGNICPTCHQPVRSPSEQSIEPVAWFRRPKEVRKLINPKIFYMLRKRLTKSNFNVLLWLIDRNYRPKINPPSVLQSIEKMGIERGYNYFVDNFFEIIPRLFSLPEYRVKKNQEDSLLRLIEGLGHRIFSEHLPLPNKTLLIIESNNMGVYLTDSVRTAKNVVNEICSIDDKIMNFSARKKEIKVARIINALADFHIHFTKENVLEKEGLLRYNIFGTRTHFSFRCVIVSITVPHANDEIHVPWSSGIVVFRPMLINYLKKRGYTHRECIKLLYDHTHVYHPLLDELLQKLIADTPGGEGIPVRMHRNPTLIPGSMQLVRITKFKTKHDSQGVIHDRSVGIPILSMVPMNCDVDGDEINFYLALDKFMVDKWERLKFYNNSFDLGEWRELASGVTLPKPVISNIASWMGFDDVHESLDDVIKVNRFLELFG